MAHDEQTASGSEIDRRCLKKKCKSVWVIVRCEYAPAVYQFSHNLSSYRPFSTEATEGVQPYVGDCCEHTTILWIDLRDNLLSRSSCITHSLTHSFLCIYTRVMLSYLHLQVKQVPSCNSLTDVCVWDVWRAAMQYPRYAPVVEIWSEQLTRLCLWLYPLFPRRKSLPSNEPHFLTFVVQLSDVYVLCWCTWGTWGIWGAWGLLQPSGLPRLSTPRCTTHSLRRACPGGFEDQRCRIHSPHARSGDPNSGLGSPLPHPESLLD